MKTSTQYILILVAAFVIGILTLPSESVHKAKIKKEIVRHDMGRIWKEKRMYRDSTGEQLTTNKYIRDNYNISILDYKAFSLGKVRNQETGKEAVVSLACFGFVYVKDMQ